MATHMTIDCGVHGKGRVSAVVCRHQLDVHDRSVGFVENSDDPDDPQAWCSDCEAVFVQEGGMTDAFVDFNNFAVVCVDCYQRLKSRHSRESGGN
jgi:hypothetical protein